MAEKEFIITDPLGLHSRSVAVLVSSFMDLPGKKAFTSRKRRLEGTAMLLGIMSMALPRLEHFVLSLEGPNEAENLQRLADMLERHGIAKVCEKVCE